MVASTETLTEEQTEGKRFTTRQRNSSPLDGHLVDLAAPDAAALRGIEAGVIQREAVHGATSGDVPVVSLGNSLAQHDALLLLEEQLVEVDGAQQDTVRPCRAAGNVGIEHGFTPVVVIEAIVDAAEQSLHAILTAAFGRSHPRAFLPRNYCVKR